MRFFRRGPASAQRDPVPARQPAQPAEPPGWDGAPRGEPGIHGVARPRSWDAVVRAEAGDLDAGRVEFVALDERTLVADRGRPTADLAPFAAALGAALPPPFRAEAVQQAGGDWAVAGSRIAVATIPGLPGSSAELVATRYGRTLHVDGRPLFERFPVLERLGETEGSEYVVRARRLDGDRFEVEAAPL